MYLPKRVLVTLLPRHMKFNSEEFGSKYQIGFSLVFYFLFRTRQNLIANLMSNNSLCLLAFAPNLQLKLELQCIHYHQVCNALQVVTKKGIFVERVWRLSKASVASLKFYPLKKLG